MRSSLAREVHWLAEPSEREGCGSSVSARKCAEPAQRRGSGRANAPGVQDDGFVHARRRGPVARVKHRVAAGPAPNDPRGARATRSVVWRQTAHTN